MPVAHALGSFVLPTRSLFAFDESATSIGERGADIVGFGDADVNRGALARQKRVFISAATLAQRVGKERFGGCAQASGVVVAVVEVNRAGNAILIPHDATDADPRFVSFAKKRDLDFVNVAVSRIVGDGDFDVAAFGVNDCALAFE